MERRAPGRRAGEPASVRIERMHRRHLRDVVRIEEATNPRPWSRKLFASELRAPDSRVYLIARVGAGIVGYGGLMLVARDGHVTNVGVASEHRRQHVGTRLVLGLARGAIAGGATALTLEVRVSNHAAQGLYRRFGFVPAGVRAAYYPPSDGPDRSLGARQADAKHPSCSRPQGREHEDALVMWASDIDTPEYRRRLFEIEAALPTPTEFPDDR
ncbi:MAG: ribosomal protein S18-alanine N-acetyltransferase [Acidimicrobiales bacterium]|nr:ribosomal protein S18-alanine N-acetyltransferase [Acidimicrobiales bacterium]